MAFNENFIQICLIILHLNKSVTPFFFITVNIFENGLNANLSSEKTAVTLKMRSFEHSLNAHNFAKRSSGTCHQFTGTDSSSYA
jgi:hypothetical protein